MKISLNKKELEIIECMAIEWNESEESKLYGGISRQDVYNLLKKLKLEIPINFTTIYEKEKNAYEQFMNEITQSNDRTTNNRK